jgi:hypothetical protein
MGDRSTVVSNPCLGSHVKEVVLTFEAYTEHTHFREGLSLSCKLVQLPCPAKKIVYTSNNKKHAKIFQGRHLNPPWPEEKPSQQAKDDLQKRLNAAKLLGATADRVDNGEPDTSLRKQENSISLASGCYYCASRVTIVCEA